MRLPDGRVHGDVRPRPGVHSRDAHGHDRPFDRLARLRAAALDRSRQPRLVFRRSSHPRRRVQPLREPDRRRAAGRHDAPRARRGAQRGVGAELGAELLSSAAVLRGQGQQALDTRRRCCATTSRCPDFRRATADISSCFACGSRTTPTRVRSRTGRRGICPSSSGRKRRERSPGSRTPATVCRSSPVSCPTTRCRTSTGSAPTSTSWTSRTTSSISSPAADTPFVYELNIWYHTLNCGFRTRISGETDFPCITDDRVGGGRSYVHLAAGADLRRVVRRRARGPVLRVGRFQPSDGFHGERTRSGDEREASCDSSVQDVSRDRARRLPAAGQTDPRHSVGATVPVQIGMELRNTRASPTRARSPSK